jgi:hypothetical protein
VVIARGDNAKLHEGEMEELLFSIQPFLEERWPEERA